LRLPGRIAKPNDWYFLVVAHSFMEKNFRINIFWFVVA
jgi:hypothetical protein